jgi:hypothetical protein
MPYDPRMTDTERSKITIMLSNEALQVVRELARWRGITMTEVFRQAVTTEKFFADALRAGDTILLKGPGRRAKMREVVIK